MIKADGYVQEEDEEETTNTHKTSLATKADHHLISVRNENFNGSRLHQDFSANNHHHLGQTSSYEAFRHQHVKLTLIFDAAGV